MGVPSDGSYGIPKASFGFPCECKGGQFKIIQGLEIDEFSKGRSPSTLGTFSEDERRPTCSKQDCLRAAASAFATGHGETVAFSFRPARFPHFCPMAAEPPPTEGMPEMSLQPPVLFAGENALPALPAGRPLRRRRKRMMKALALQQELARCSTSPATARTAPRLAPRPSTQMVVEVVNGGGEPLAASAPASTTSPIRTGSVTSTSSSAAPAGAGLPDDPQPVRSAADCRGTDPGCAIVEAAPRPERARCRYMLIETHGALREGFDRSPPIDGVSRSTFGLMDFVSGHHGADSRQRREEPRQFDPLVVRAKADIAAAALANGVVPSHNVTTELQEVAVIRHDAERARRELRPAHVEHPPQPDPAGSSRRCSPTSPRSRKPQRSCGAAQDNAWGPIRHQGRLHDRASHRYYWELLQRARNTGMELPGETRQRFFTGAGH